MRRGLPLLATPCSVSSYSPLTLPSRTLLPLHLLPPTASYCPPTRPPPPRFQVPYARIGTGLLAAVAIGIAGANRGKIGVFLAFTAAPLTFFAVTLGFTVGFAVAAAAFLALQYATRCIGDKCRTKVCFITYFSLYSVYVQCTSFAILTFYYYL